MTAIASSLTSRTFRYKAVRRDGAPVADLVEADDAPTALRRLAADGLVVIELTEVNGAPGQARRKLRLAERVLIMWQLSLMLEAGVPLLEAVATVAEGVQAQDGRQQLLQAAAALKGGARLGEALREHMPGFPAYVYAMAEVGEASGRLSDVLGQAAEQMGFEDGLRREVLNALTYPSFLAVAGVTATTFIFVEVIPRFSAMLKQSGAALPLLSRVVLGASEFVQSHLLLLALLLLAAAAASVAASARPEVRAWFYAAARRTPVLGQALRAREIAIWAKLTAFALNQGVGLMSALNLSRRSAPRGALHEALQAAEAELRAGVSLDVALAGRSGLTAMDLSLLRAGQRSGTLAEMFGFLAKGYDDRLRDMLKRTTALIEPLAIAAISVFVGAIVLSLVMALSSLYQGVQ